MSTMTMRKKDWTCVILHRRTLSTGAEYFHASVHGLALHDYYDDHMHVGLRVRHITGSALTRADTLRQLERVL